MHALEYISWRRKLLHLAKSWKRLASEVDLPACDESNETIGRWAASIRTRIGDQISALTIHAPKVRQELPILFPFGLAIDRVAHDLEVVERARDAIELNLLRHRLETSRAKIRVVHERLAAYQVDLTNQICSLIATRVGSTELGGIDIVDQWSTFLAELKRIHSQASDFDTIKNIAATVSSSGAPQWSSQLLENPVLDGEDRLTPSNWREAWVWAQQEGYLKAIDGRARLAALAQERVVAIEELERRFREVVRSRTFLNLHQSMTDRVRSALIQFGSAIRNIGAGTGIRARRFRRDARDAMDSCYSAVPCWIMPTWRVSESLPPILGSFDLVIVDEASQSDVQALPAILRGKKVLVVGDDKQVSPMAVGVEEKKILQLRHSYLEDQPFKSMLLPGQSLYDLMGAVFPGQRIMLKEHFRCVEPIIRFSAREFYGNQIRPLRIPKASERLDPPLVDILVLNGKKEGKRNEAEALVIVDEIEKIVGDSNYEKRSIGVVSLVGANQALMIQSMLLARIGEEKFVRHQLACGDAAAFQGKERDIMFISMVEGAGYRAKTGLMYQQRFNVALSRARDRMYLVT
jgi:hypothetical protein